MPIKSYRDFDVYTRARKLIVPVYQLADSLPQDERFDLRDQMRRACKSVVDNFVEDTAIKTRPSRLNPSGVIQWDRQTKWSSISNRW